MKKPEHLLIKDFNYSLPEERIAKYPLLNRDDSKLLIYKNKKIVETVYRQLADYLPEQSLLVLNNTKVVEVRLLFQKPTGSIIELFCLEPADNRKDIATAMLQTKTVRWKCLVGGAKKWKEEILTKRTYYNGKELLLTTKRIARLQDYFVIEFSWNSTTVSFAEILHLFGNIPLPPYLNRASDISDEERYQTIYAQYNGSVAAPTAGLHFTNTLFESLNQKHVHTAFVTLHVGAGTFKPVKTETVAAHDMHAEFLEITTELIEQLINHINKTIITVGTTSLRTIESLYWLGVKVVMNENIIHEDLYLRQWEAYELPQNIAVIIALQSLLQWMRKHRFQRLLTRTQILIAPGYTLKIADALITNFHQPQSTLLLLIAAVAGDNWKEIYNYAMENNFRFLSYGDGSLLWKNEDAFPERE